MALLETFEAAFIALYILLLFWFLTSIPLFVSKTVELRAKSKDFSGLEANSGAGADDDDDRIGITRSYRAYREARDGVLILFVALVISVVEQADPASVITLSYIYMAFWITLIGASYLTDDSLVLASLRSFGFILATVMGIIAWSSSSKIPLIP